MSRLVKNELVKILKKKILYILFIVILLIISINTIVGTSIYQGTIVDHTEEAREQKQIELNNKLKELDYKKDVDDYVELKTKLDILNLKKEYTLNSWQEQVIVKNEDEIEQMIKEINIYTYKIKNNEKLVKAKEIYNKYLQPLKEDNWKTFIAIEIEKVEKNIESLKKKSEKMENEDSINSIKKQISDYEFDLQFLRLRLKEDISYEKTDRNAILEEYKNSKRKLETYSQNSQENNYNEKVQYQDTLAKVNELEYKIYHNIPILKSDNARDMLKNSFEFYEILIVLVIIVISGAIVSDEFNKGTIKLLLVKPHKRYKILLSKLLATIILTILLILFVVLVQTVVGGLVYGFKDYSVPIVQYDFSAQKVITMNVFYNLLILAIAKVPMYLLILSITFAISTTSCNTSVSIVLGMIIYLSKNIIYLNDNAEFSKYLLPTNWDFTRYLFGKLPEVSFLKFDFSIMICLVSYIFIMLITFAYFKNKDVKNI